MPSEHASFPELLGGFTKQSGVQFPSQHSEDALAAYLSNTGPTMRQRPSGAWQAPVQLLFIVYQDAGLLFPHFTDEDPEAQRG